MSTLTRHPAGLVPPAGRALPPRPPALRPATATPPPLKDPSDLAAWWDDMRERWEVRRGVALTSARACLIEVADAHDAARALAWLGRAHSLAGDHEDAERAGQQAHDEFVEHCARQWTARSLEMLGQSAAAAGRGDDAVSRFAQALDQYSGLSAVDAERVRRQLAAVQ